MNTSIDEGKTFRLDLLQGVQRSMRLLRLHLDISGQELADYIGVTRQTINNFEKEHREMGIPYFLAFCSLLDEICRAYSSFKKPLMFIIKNNLVNKECFSEDIPLLSQWFSTFAHLSDYYENNLECSDAVLAIEDEILQKAERIYVDTSFLLQEGATEFLLRFSIKLKTQKKYLSISSYVINKLRNCKIEYVGRDKVLAIVAYSALIKLGDKNLVDVNYEVKEPINDYEHLVGFPVKDCYNKFVAILVGETAMAKKLAIIMENHGIEGCLGRLDDNGNLISWNI